MDISSAHLQLSCVQQIFPMHCKRKTCQFIDHWFIWMFLSILDTYKSVMPFKGCRTLIIQPLCTHSQLNLASRKSSYCSTHIQTLSMYCLKWLNIKHLRWAFDKDYYFVDSISIVTYYITDTCGNIRWT